MHEYTTVELFRLTRAELLGLDYEMVCALARLPALSEDRTIALINSVGFAASSRGVTPGHADPDQFGALLERPDFWAHEKPRRDDPGGALAATPARRLARSRG